MKHRPRRFHASTERIIVIKQPSSCLAPTCLRQQDRRRPRNGQRDGNLSSTAIVAASILDRSTLTSDGQAFRQLG